MNSKKQNSSSTKMFVWLILGIIATIFIWSVYFYAISSNVTTKNNESEYLFAIPTGANVSTIITKLSNEISVKETSGFVLLAKLVNLSDNIYPGLYKLTNGMSNMELVMLFRSGKRQPVNLTLKFGRYADDILRVVAPKLEADYDEMRTLLQDTAFLDSLGFTKETAICLFLPDTYQFKWNTSAKNFLFRMHKEYLKFWDSERLQKAEKLGLTPFQVMTIASIINQESNKNDEKARIAGVYVNRYKLKMPLQADPTVKYALGDFTIKRVRKGHLKTNSPYNTYKYLGLPPGPICTPDKVDIDAVLNMETHNYIFFCAKPDYSGYHRFAANYSLHVKYAQEYSKWLDSENIQ